MSREVQVNIAQMSLRRLRAAIQNNEVSFPSQVPIFECQSRADIQWRLVELYFIRNWTCPELGRRYGVTMERARQLVFNWVQRAVVLGYLQEIPPRAARPSSLAEPEGTVAPQEFPIGRAFLGESAPPVTARAGH